MAQKKNIRSDNTYIISQNSTDNPKLGAKILSDGRESLFLDYYFGYQMVYNGRLDKMVAKKSRKREFLSLYLWQAPRTPMERQQNKEMLQLAQKIRFEKGQEVLESGEGYRIEQKKGNVNFLDYYQTYIDNYSKKDIRVVVMGLHRFKDFLKETPEYRVFSTNLKPTQVTKDMMVDFVEYLQSRSEGEGAHTIYARFKKVINYAIEHDVMTKNPCKGVTIKVDEGTLKKEVLSSDEIRTLWNTHYNRENPTIERAFMFSLLSGLRYCDVKSLTYGNVDYSNRLLSFEQNKTKGHSKSSGVVLPLSDDMLALIGKPTDGDDEALIFPLPSHTMCLKALRVWTAKAGIEKHITWHCARHSFATNLLTNDVNIVTVANLLGHADLKCTQKYVRVVDKLKQDAINSLPKLNIQ